MSKVAVITGGNKGIGFAIVQELCKRFKGDVYLTARSDTRGNEAVQQIEREGLKVKYHQLDIDNMESIQAFHDDMVKGYGGIDVLVNNAAILYQQNSKAPLSEQATITLRTNYFGTLNVLNCLLPIIKPGGRVVNLSSQWANSSLKKCSPTLQTLFRSTSITESQLTDKMKEFVDLAQTDMHLKNGYDGSPYGVSKIGVNALTRIKAKVLLDQGRGVVLINCCCPGWVKTDMGGPSAGRSPEQGADTAVYLALLPEGAKEPQGEFLYDRRILKW